jgi:hypothetical protein
MTVATPQSLFGHHREAPFNEYKVKDIKRKMLGYSSRCDAVSVRGLEGE